MEKLDNCSNVKKKKNMCFSQNLGFELILKVMATVGQSPPSTFGNVNSLFGLRGREGE